jgi:GT2 family glycosyltransferase
VVTLNLPGEIFDAAAWPDLDIVVIRNATPRGFGANHNTAFAHCKTSWFAVLNPDLRLPSDPFERLLETAASLARPGAVAPRIVDSTGRDEDAVRTNLTPWSVLRRKLDRNAGRARNATRSDTREFFWLAGMFLLVSTPAWRQVGGFDERFFLYCEDYDLCARLDRAGYLLAVDRSVSAVHDAQRDSRRSQRHLRWHVGSLLRVWTSSAFWWVSCVRPFRRRPAHD